MIKPITIATDGLIGCSASLTYATRGYICIIVTPPPYEKPIDTGVGGRGWWEPEKRRRSRRKREQELFDIIIIIAQSGILDE